MDMLNDEENQIMKDAIEQQEYTVGKVLTGSLDVKHSAAEAGERRRTCIASRNRDAPF